MFLELIYTISIYAMILLHSQKKYDVEPEMLKFEITESAYTDNPHQLLKTMESLQNYGFEVLMDDFGSGYSSLNMLKDVPVDILKIDMKFIEDLDVSSRAGSVMTNVIRMAKWLNMSVVAEGVETKAQLVVLRNIGCDKVQGYYLSKPLPAEEFEKLMEGQGAGAEEKEHEMSEVDMDFIWSADQKFAEFIGGMIDGMGVYEVVGDSLEIVRVNDGYFEMMGGSAKELFSKKTNVLDFVCPSDREKLMEACALSKDEGCVQSIEVRRIHNSGKIIWINIKINYLGKLGDNDAFYFGMNNISYRKNLENTVYLRQYSDTQKENFNEVLLFDYTDNCIVPILRSHNWDYPIQWENELDMVLLDVAENIVHPEDKKDFLEFYDEKRLEQTFALETNTGIYIEIRMKSTGEKFQWVLIKIVKLEDPFCKKTFLSFIKNIDKDKKLSYMLDESEFLAYQKKIELKLQNVKSMLENVINNAPLGVGIFQITDKVVPLYLSDEGYKIFGFSRKEQDDFLDRCQFWSELREAGFIENLHEKSTSNQLFTSTIKGEKKGGTPVTVQVIGTCREDAYGNVLCYAYFSEAENPVEHRRAMGKIENCDIQKSGEIASLERNILIVDNDEAERKMLKNILEDTYNVLEAENSAGALELLENGKLFITAVLLDIEALAKDGYSLLNIIRVDATLSEIPVIAITGEDDKDAETKAISFGVTDFLTKPFKPAVIKHRIASHIKLKETTTSKNAVEKIINNLPGGVCIFEISDKISTRYISEGFTTICGYSVEEYLKIFSEDMTQLVCCEDVQQVKKSIYKAKNANEPIDVEYHINCKNGEMGYNRIQANFAYEDQGMAVYYGVITDITAKELEIRQRYDRERAFIRSLTGDSRIFFECDLVTGRIIPVGEKAATSNNPYDKITGLIYWKWPLQTLFIRKIRSSSRKLEISARLRKTYPMGKVKLT